MVVMRCLGRVFLRTPSWYDIGLEEIGALEQKGLISCFGERVGKAISKVESSRMIPLAEAQICSTGCLRALKADRDHINPKIANEIINELNRKRIFLLACSDDRCLVNGDSRNCQDSIARRCLRKATPFRLAENDGNNRRRVDDHQSKCPLSL